MRISFERERATISLNKFQPRDYQRCIFEALERDNYKRVMAIWPRRCLSGDTHIAMANGSWKFLRDVQAGDKILSWNGNTFIPDLVKNSWKTGVKPTKKLQSYGHLPIITSEDHCFAVVTANRNKVSWIKVSDISNCRQVLNYGGIDAGCKHDPDMAEFIGYMTCDGYCSGYQQPKFTNTNNEILRRVEYLAKKLFGYQAIWRKKGNGYDLGFSNGTRGGGTFKNKIKELFRAENQDVPKSRKRYLSAIWEYDQKSLLRFFAAVISSDGNICCHKTGFDDKQRNRTIPPANEITINCGMSDALGWDIYWLLRKIGIFPQVPYKERGSNWKIKISKGRDIKLLLSGGPVYGKEDSQKKVLSRISKCLPRIKKWNGCYRAKPRITDAEQEELYDIETEKNHNFIANGYVVHNSGKDLSAWNLCIRELIRSVKTIYYVFPTFTSGRRILWDAITNDGFRILDYLPKELVESRNEQLMRIKLKNGSIFQVIGSDSYDNTLVGTNPQGVVFSEFALSNPMAYSFVRPILSANKGWVLIISTPRGKNTLYDLYNTATKNPDDWFVSKLTIDDTKHISMEDILRERETGEMSEDLQLQEYWCSFDMGVEGGYYTKYIDALRLKDQIGSVPWEPQYPVHTAWDIGVRDNTSIIFFQVAGQTLKIIDCYEKNKEGVEHYATVIKSKPYVYGKHIGPHDIRNFEFTAGITRWEKARQLGITFQIADKLSIMDGIEAVRSTLPKMYFDERNCKGLIKALENYRQEFDAKKRIYKKKPFHDQFSHYCFVGDTKILTKAGNIPIKDIKAGTFVRTPTGFKRVLKVHERNTTTLCDIRTGKTELSCTAEHRIFTQRGAIKADFLCYADTLEYHGVIRSWLWKKIYGYYSKGFDLKGFKKTILSLKMKRRRCLMDSFIDGMEDILSGEKVRDASSQIYIERFGTSIMERFRRAWSFIISITTPKITSYKISKLSIRENICDITPIFRLRGQNQKPAKNCCAVSIRKRLNGIGVKKEENGIGSMQKILCQALEGLNTKKDVRFAKKNILVNKCGKNSVAEHVRQKIDSTKDWISSNVLVASVKIYLLVTNMLSKKHAVKNVRSYQCDIPKKVYDLTIEDDNCYYANGYLVSNSDAMRYLCVFLPKLRTSLTPEDIDRFRTEAKYGKQSKLPPFFRDSYH